MEFISWQGPADRRRKFIEICKLLLVILPLTLMPGCSSVSSLFSFTAKPAPETAESLAADGLTAFNYGRYHAALEIFEKLKDRYPFSQASLLAELKAADANFYLKNYDEALLLYKEFEERHPSHEAISYVIFQIAMCHYKKIDTIDRDTTGAANAIQVFSRLVRTFPASPYTAEASARIKAARDFLARHEFYVATFYVRIDALPEAEGRLEYLLSNYPDTAIAPEAAKLLTELKAGNPPRRSWFSWLPGLD